MAETIAITPETTETTPTIIETTPATSAQVTETTAKPKAEPKKTGRPSGSKDKLPRKKKIQIVEEQIALREAPAAVEAPIHVQEEPRIEYEPPSPRSTLREASRHILELQRLKISTRKSYLESTYTKGLRSLKPCPNSLPSLPWVWLITAE